MAINVDFELAGPTPSAKQPARRPRIAVGVHPGPARSESDSGYDGTDNRSFRAVEHALALVDEPDDVVLVAADDSADDCASFAFTQQLREASSAGWTPMLAMMGDAPPKLQGVVGELMRSDVEQVLAVGPAAQPARASAGPIIIVLNDDCHLDRLLAAAKPWAEAAGRGITVARCARNDRTPRALHPSLGEVWVPPLGGSRTIAALASETDAPLIVARSWYRWSSTRPSAASQSLALVADAPCSVLIVN